MKSDPLGFGVWMDRQVEQMRALEASLDKLGLVQHLPINTVTDSLSLLSAGVARSSALDRFMEDAVKLPRSYMVFARRQSQRILEAKTDEEGTAAALVLDHAGAMLGDSSAVLQQAMEENVAAGPPSNGLPNELNLFAMLNRSMASRYKRSTVAAIEVAANNAPSTLVNRLGCEIIDLVNGLNESYSLNKGKPLFEPSMRTMRAAQTLPAHVARNETDFAGIVDLLYFLLWEASGAGKGKVYELLAGEPEGEPLQMVRNLRRVYRHDLEQEGGTETKLLKGGEAFKRLINRPCPYLPSQWGAAQIALYLEVRGMLAEIGGRINAPR